MTNALENLIKTNEFPVVFMGAGISKRFLEDFPDWTNLLAEFWRTLGKSNFYGEFNNIRAQIEKNNPFYSEKEKDHYANILMGTILENEFNSEFNKENVKIPEFNTQAAYKTKISPFKKAISNRFKKYTIKTDMKDEYNSFKKMLLKTQIILTTNYDSFIEDSYNSISSYKLTKYIGQKGFFRNTYGYAELYKLHGCITSPSDIIITEDDYKKFENNSVLISAKIISMLMNSPIIFIGYSFTDINVRKIIKEFTRSITDQEINILEQRLILIEWEENQKDFVEEVLNDRDLGCKLKVIKTDNFSKVFNTISNINQGIAPTEIRKYQHIIKQLIIDRGKKGTLNSVLLSPEELDKLEGDIQNKNITVALGDAKYIFQIPDIITYSLDYLKDEDEISTDIRLRFAVGQTGRFLINKLLDKKLIVESSLHASEKEKLISKIGYYSNFNKHYKTVNPSSVIKSTNLNNVRSIAQLNVKKEKIYETISINIENLDLEEVRGFLIEELTTLKESGEIKLKTELRRLMLLYDILKYKGGTT